jgi:hypothetical protein
MKNNYTKIRENSQIVLWLRNIENYALQLSKTKVRNVTDEDYMSFSFNRIYYIAK